MSKLQELIEQRRRIEQEIADLTAAERSTQLAQVREVIATFGFTADELFAKPKKQKGPAVQRPAKYRDPETGSTWSGRGKPPQWIQGKPREPYLI
ncbi:DNA-binding protein H-NS [Pararobbsia alpina]|uniref:H-NS histone family protein n=1 Tax=Pararobbsia alpina TaxID=621374 RepID=UPI0039A5E3A4